MKRTFLCVAIALLAAGSAEAKKVKKALEQAAGEAVPANMGAAAPLRAETPWGISGEARVTTGAFSGYEVRTDTGAMVRPEVRLTPQYSQGALRISLPLVVSHRQTLGANLLETIASGGAELKYRFSPRLRLGAEAGVYGAWRPGWQDLYQPIPGGYLPTDRYSHVDKRFGAQIAGIPLRHQHARLKYRYTMADYAIDPAYDPTNPTHLTPLSYDLHSLEGSWRYLGDGWKAGARLDTFVRSYDYAYSRDAGTGRTHAGAGGPPPNPLQVFRGVEPALEGSWKAEGIPLELSASYGLAMVEDTYQGYYSSIGHHPEAKVELELMHRATLSLAVEALLRTYGENSYAAGGSHPPLTFGDRRVDNKVSGTFEARVPLRPDLALTGTVSYVRRATNFPSYVPGVYPASRDYEIDWSYSNLVAQVGARWSFDVGAAAADDGQ